MRLVVTGEVGAPAGAGGVRDTLVEVGLGESNMPVIVDLRWASLSGQPDARAVLRERVARWATSGIPHRPVAVLVKADEPTGFGTMIASTLAAAGYPCQVFDDDGAAVTWLTTR